jgi:hypothetical protein
MTTLSKNWSAVTTLLCHHTPERPLSINAGLYDELAQVEEIKPFLNRAQRTPSGAA